jgi:hypothetical protein
MSTTLNSTVATTNFPTEVVPQAPEDPLFGLMRAYKADQSPDKIDLVRLPPQRCVAHLLLTLMVTIRALVLIVTTMRSLGSCL